jgi:hypothetical protein
MMFVMRLGYAGPQASTRRQATGTRMVVLASPVTCHKYGQAGALDTTCAFFNLPQP